MAGEMPGTISDGVGGCSLTCWYATATGVSARNGGRAVSSSNRMMPVEYRSVRASTSSPFACSGEKYWAVPRIVPVSAIVDPLSEMARAMPKSMTLI